MTEISPVLLAVARQRVARGVKWLDRRAKYDLRFKDWRMRLMWILHGQVHSLVHTCYDTNNVLALVLRWERTLISRVASRVTWATVARELGFGGTFGGMKALFLGFDEGYPRQYWYQSDTIAYSSALDKAWEEALGHYVEPDAPNLYYELAPTRRPAASASLGRRLGFLLTGK